MNKNLLKKLLPTTTYPLQPKKGFTLSEMLVTLGIVSVLIGLTTFNLLNANDTSIITGTTDTLVSDLRQQQSKAMIGATEGRTTHDAYGIHFNTNNYVLFHGPVYNAGDSSNFTVNLSADLSFNSIQLPNNEIIFASVSGEFANFVNGSNTVQIQKSTTNQSKTITINEYGVITAIN